MRDEIEEFNRQQSIKYRLPDAATDDLVAELEQREEVWSRRLADGERLEIHGPYTVLAVRK